MNSVLYVQIVKRVWGDTNWLDAYFSHKNDVFQDK